MKAAVAVGRHTRTGAKKRRSSSHAEAEHALMSKQNVRTQKSARVQSIDWCDEILTRKPQSADELTLAALEPSWADFLYALRTARRIVRVPSKRGVRMRGYDKLHRIFEDYRQQLGEGRRAAVFYALVMCADENVPMPYWLADEVIRIAAEVLREPSRDERPKGLHELFGLSRLLPTGGKKASTTRRDRGLRIKLWTKVHELISSDAKASIGGKLNGQTAAKWQQARQQLIDRNGIDRYLTKALRLLKFPYLQRKARMMFDEQEDIQSRHLHASKGITVHKHRIK